VRCPESLEPESLARCFARGTVSDDKLIKARSLV
jgi:hypothetical protein